MIQINHGMMEMGYIDHLTSGAVGSSSQFDPNMLSISMTATTDTMGNLVFGISILKVFNSLMHILFNEAIKAGCFYAGSSREFCGFDADTCDLIIKKIWDRSCDFFPCLRKYSLDLLEGKIRVGLRPWSE